MKRCYSASSLPLSLEGRGLREKIDSFSVLRGCPTCVLKLLKIVVDGRVHELFEDIEGNRRNISADEGRVEEHGTGFLILATMTSVSKP